MGREQEHSDNNSVWVVSLVSSFFFSLWGSHILGSSLMFLRPDPTAVAVWMKFSVVLSTSTPRLSTRLKGLLITSNSLRIRSALMSSLIHLKGIPELVCQELWWVQMEDLTLWSLAPRTPTVRDSSTRGSGSISWLSLMISSLTEPDLDVVDLPQSVRK